MIGGVGKVVEIDEAIWRRRKYGKGRRKVQLWIFGMIERSSEEEKGKVLLFLVYRRTRNVLLPIIKRHVHAGTEIHSDEWKAYSTLSDNGFVHKTVNHSRRFKDRFTKACTNVIEGTWSRMRRFMPMHGVREAHIAEYLASYVYVKHLKPSFIDFCKVVCEYSDSEYVKAVEAIDDGEEDDDDDEEIEDDVENFDEEESSSTEDEGSEMDAGDGADASEWEELDIDHEKRKR
ncbi:putative Uncharacterized transposase-like protein [Monocercomonoides exilis]|uniref:putative Uncharacterized transposase-like protein n=1 Tax=Monocercomonoides exilis TaxID=2049356 RepID=UPI00355A5205|nr:putative Uncharacterized transposase-like protein [Monocercomonoides exilis]|eukprot:MONOS_8612.1-p1 / transcript=MONOS_8612.1 / gene=MONOS_8612 / organism=Monocercomonoides_exilis_PA203 / gene_product=Uncharacterized transposase-like protein HI1328.1 / transcript_product=Uncharacterized transposase-like protein HI1328.1 / location=Mono_scaffold00328:62759-63454(-) / protein_length=231 / sequence_SO=supercontig / SO=protein_coding / is_pseudo=false